MTSLFYPYQQGLLWKSLLLCSLLLLWSAQCSVSALVSVTPKSSTGTSPSSPSGSSFHDSSQDVLSTTLSTTTQEEKRLEKHQQKQQRHEPLGKLQSKLLKQVRQVAKDYEMLQNEDHIMVCMSGGKDSATLLQLLLLLQAQLKPAGVEFQITAVHVDQKQPGYNGTALVQWFEELGIAYKIIEEDTYSIVVDKTKPNQSYCTLCSRLRRGILYSTALDLGCNKIALGHHADDALETLLLNMLHASQLKAMPARYTSRRGQLAVLRPLITSLEDDIREYAALSEFPILPCNLCSNQANLQRPQVKMLLSTLESFNPKAKQNLLHSLTDVRPSHLLDQSLRQAMGMDPVTGEEEDESEESNAP